jgi:hypothetical protein
VHCQNHEQAELIRTAVCDGVLTVGCLVDYMGRSFRTDIELGAAVMKHGGLVVVDPHLVARFGNKASMHRALARAGVGLPHTKIWHPATPARAQTLAERQWRGPRLVCKPAHGSGSTGVILDFDGSAAALAEALDDDRDDELLIQEFVEPLDLAGRPAWFRVYNCFGRVLSCWWNPETHATELVHPGEISAFGLHSLERISRTVQAISGYTWFSSEIALTIRHGRRVCLPIDYLNNKCFMMTHSEVGPHGIPDLLAEIVARTIVERATTHCDCRPR